MTEIEFLVSLLLDSNTPDVLKTKIVERIGEVERSRSATPLVWPGLPSIQPQPLIAIPCRHEYPNPWHSVLPPHCKKCGQQAFQYTITCTNDTSNKVETGLLNHLTTGLM